MLLRPTPLSEKIGPVHMDEALARVRGVASSVTHLDALLRWRLALHQILH
ncbi:MAG: hypothetical protein HRT56_06100, partial [Coraliomargarita sp.]|nr:hypothetical protein [Coraliomargarita sp.]